MNARTQKGVSLVELMVAVVIASLTVVVVLEVLATYNARKRTITIGNDAEINAAAGLFELERELRMAGAGLTLPNGFACNAGVNLYFDDQTVLDGAPLPLVRIIDGGAGPDRITLIRSDANFGPAPATIVAAMAGPDANVVVDWNADLERGDVFLAGSPDGNRICTLMQLTRAPQAGPGGVSLEHSSAGSEYNPENYGASFDSAIRYEIGDSITNLGRFGLRTYAVLCSDGNAPGLDNACNLVALDALAAPDPPALADGESIASQVVDLQAWYGVAPANSQTVNEWVDATGATWAAPTDANQRRIKALRLAIVTRGNLEREVVSPDELVLWDDDPDSDDAATERKIALDDDQRRYRYKVLTVIVPLINVIWAGV